MTSWLLVDANNLAWRSFWTTGHLQHEGDATGVIYGFLQQLRKLEDLFAPDAVAFAFDSPGPLIRKEIDPRYKENRKTAKPEDEAIVEARRECRRQIRELEDKVLVRMGYRNVFSQRGYEADDIIAVICKYLPDEDDAVIVSSDEDLLQCIGPSVVWYSPHTSKCVTEASFTRDKGFSPAMWAHVKALAGCQSDNIKGIQGIGEGYAGKWYAGKLKTSSAAYKKIQTGLDIHNHNIKLVRLPLDGTECPHLRPDKPSAAGWRAVAEEYGFKV